MNLDLDDFLAPLPDLPNGRFLKPLRDHCLSVVPLWPGSEELRADGDPDPLWNWNPDGMSDAQIDRWEGTSMNVALISTAHAAILQATNRAGQRWLEEYDRLPWTPRWMTSRTRCYLFKYADLPTDDVWITGGVRLLGEGTAVICPGSITPDGRLLHWEVSPDRVPIPDLPEWLSSVVYS